MTCNSMYRKNMSQSQKALDSGPFERLFSGNATAKMIDFLISSQEWDYSESDIARFSGISLRTYSEIPKLLRLDLVKQVRPVGNAKMYQLDKSHKIGQQVEKLALLLTHEEIRNKKEKVIPPIEVRR